MRDIFGAQAVREMIDDLVPAAVTAGAVGLFIGMVAIFCAIGAGA